MANTLADVFKVVKIRGGMAKSLPVRHVYRDAHQRFLICVFVFIRRGMRATPSTSLSPPPKDNIGKFAPDSFFSADEVRARKNRFYIRTIKVEKLAFLSIRFCHIIVIFLPY